MVSMLICTQTITDNERFATIAKQCVPFNSKEEWKIGCCNNLTDLNRMLSTMERVDLLCIDVSQENFLIETKHIRKEYPGLVILIIVSQKQSPMTYLNPSIMAASLLMKPINESIIREVLNEVFEYIRRRDMEKDYFIIENKDEKVRIEFNDILLFESRNKKIFVYNGQEEYEFYDTLENLMNHLPEYFVRCHRSYVCNFNRVKELRLTENNIILDDQSIVPLSRSYRNHVRSMFYESRSNTKGICVK